MKKVLILGGQGRVSWQITQDIISHNKVEIIITGKWQKRAISSNSIRFLALDIKEKEQLEKAIQETDLVINCVGTFHHKDA